NLDLEPQQSFDLENGNVADSLIGNVSNSHEENEIVIDSCEEYVDDDIDDDSEDELGVLKLTIGLEFEM
ncbi:4497_t:CDS:1, partial [Gigaspora rosea]